MVSGSGTSVFATSSTTQTKMVQACLHYIWNRAAETGSIDGGFGPMTKGQTKWVLATKLGKTGDITTSNQNWHSFLAASMLNGLGVRTY